MIKELLTRLADSVRLKSGKTEKMTIEQLTKAIDGITVSGDLGFTSGKIVPSADNVAVTIKHGLNQVPGAVLFIKNGTFISGLSSSQTSRYEALLSIVLGEEASHIYCYSSIRRSSVSSGSSTVISARNWIKNSITASMFGTGTSSANYYVSNINEESFITPKYLNSGAEYIWVAFRSALA